MPTADTPHRSAARARAAEAYRRVRYTPLLDALTLRLTARLDPRETYRGLPAPAEELVRSVARKTRLSRVEKADVARELASHFHEGLDAGASPEELVQSFGDPRAAARLIRRAKRRARSLPHKLLAWTSKSLLTGTALIVLSWALLAWSYYGSSPGPMPDRLAKYNARAAAIPAEDNAWPIYLEAMFAAAPTPRSDIDPEAREKWHTDWSTLSVAQSAREGEIGWDLAVARASASRTAIDAIHRAAARPKFGIENSTTMPAWVADLNEHRFGKRYEQDTEPAKHPLFETRLPHLSELRHLSRDTAVDVRISAANGDFERATQSLIAIYHLAAHLNQDPWAVSDLVSYSVASLGNRAIGEELLLHRNQYTRDQLTRIAHALIAWDPTISFDSDRQMVLEILDATFTPSGRVTDLDTLDEFVSTYDELGSWSPDEHLFEEQPYALGLARPLLAWVIAPRDQQVEMLDRVITYYQAQSARPPWEREPVPESMRLRDNTLRSLRFAPLAALGRPDWPIGIRDRAHLERDSLLTAIAIELYRRDTGLLPDRLADIPTKLLPAPPRDPVDGELIRYRPAEHDDPPHVKQAGYLLYTIGNDGRDNGGKPNRIPWKTHPMPDWTIPPEERETPAEGDCLIFPREPGSVNLDAAADLGLIDPVEYWSATDN